MRIVAQGYVLRFFAKAQNDINHKALIFKAMQKEIRLTDGSIVLRPYRLADANTVYEAVRESISELVVWMPWAHADYSIQETRMWIASCAGIWAKDTEYNFAILDAGDGSFLGGCGLNKVDLANRFANLGYWVRSICTKKGVATASVRLLAQFAFEELKLNRLEIGAASGNVASLRVAEKLGATRAGTQIAEMVFRDKVYDRMVFSLTRENFEKTRHISE